MKVVEWQDCYDDSWKGTIVPEAFAHPAKMARGLVDRIFHELGSMGALKRGDVVVDPFGGIGSTGIAGAYRGLRVVCCELEPKFVELASRTFELHRGNLAALGCPQPIIVSGDSRKLGRFVHAAMKASVVIDAAWKERTVASVVVSSPPYVGISSGAGGLNTEDPREKGQQSGRNPESPSQNTDQRYGDKPGQLAKMPAGDVEAVVSSPPFPQPYTGGGGINKRGYNPDGGEGEDKVGSRTFQSLGGERSQGNLEVLPLEAPAGQETFWTASQQIVRETFALLKPGGYAVWVVKAYVKGGKLVDFPGDWRRLCEHAGFETVREVHAMLVREEVYGHLFDGEVTKRTERKSFFRRLHESKGSPRIDWETVWFMRKPMEAPHANPETTASA